MSGANVHIVDDDESFLRAVSRLLGRSGFQVAAYPSAAELLAALRPDSVGCVVADLNMPGMDGLALQQSLQRSSNPLPVVFLTAHGGIPATVQAMRHGAEDFLTKDAPSKDLIAAINRALERNQKEREERKRLEAVRRRLELLSDREREVMQHVVQGKLNKQIADDLGIHERTVKLHRTAITTKLGVPSVAELTKLWLEAGLPMGS
jgi:FixJ family two-component response regulator